VTISKFEVSDIKGDFGNSETKRSYSEAHGSELIKLKKSKLFLVIEGVYVNIHRILHILWKVL
jgi:hypothetical protein